MPPSTSFLSHVRKLDQFGAQVNLNYKGNQYYKTLGGALATMALCTLILVYFCIQLTKVMGHVDPQISVYPIMESRSQMEETLRLGEHKSAFLFGFNDQSYIPVALEPRIGKFALFQVSYGVQEGTFEQIGGKTEIEYENFDYRKYEGTDLVVTSDISRNLLTPKNLDDLGVKGGTFDVNREYVQIEFLPCIQEFDPTCASEEEVRDFLDSNFFMFITMQSFIDFEKVKSEAETVEQTPIFQLSQRVSYDAPSSFHLELDEHRATLIDERVNFFELASPKELFYLTFSDTFEAPFGSNNFPNFTVTLSLSKRVVIEKRIVYDTFMMLSDVGGLYEVFRVAVALLCVFLEQRFYLASTIMEMFKVQNDQRLIESIQIRKSSTWLNTLTCGFYPRDKVQRHILRQGKLRFNKELDIVEIVRQSRAFKSLLKLLLTERERYLLQFKSQDSVIDLAKTNAQTSTELRAPDDLQVMSLTALYQSANELSFKHIKPTSPRATAAIRRKDRPRSQEKERPQNTETNVLDQSDLDLLRRTSLSVEMAADGKDLSIKRVGSELRAIRTRTASSEKRHSRKKLVQTQYI